MGKPSLRSCFTGQIYTTLGVGKPNLRSRFIGQIYKLSGRLDRAIRGFRKKIWHKQLDLSNTTYTGSVHDIDNGQIIPLLMTKKEDYGLIFFLFFL